MNNFSTHFLFLFDGFTGPDVLPGVYNWPMVALSILLAIIASYIALEVAQKLSASAEVENRQLWLVAGATPMGLGIWGMHFLGMLAFKLPVETNFHELVTFVSIVPAFLASYLALSLIGRPDMRLSHLLGGGVLFGAGIGVMHYVGMAAVIAPVDMYYRVDFFLISIVSAVVLAIISLSTRYAMKAIFPHAHEVFSVAVGAGIMGLAISSMHYIAMKATVYFSGTNCLSDTSDGLSTEMLLIASGSVVFFLGLCLVIIAELQPKYRTVSPE